MFPFKDIEGPVSPTSCQEGVYPNHPSHFADVDSTIPTSIVDALQPLVFVEADPHAIYIQPHAMPIDANQLLDTPIVASLPVDH